MSDRSLFTLPNPLWMGLLLIPIALGALWTSEQADAQGFVVQPVIPELTLDVDDAYVAEDLLKL